MKLKTLTKAIALSIKPKSALLTACTLLTLGNMAQATDLHFSYDAEGEVKSMTNWGVDTAWPSPDNVRQSIYHMGVDQVDVIRINYFLDEALDENGEIGPNSKRQIDYQLQLAAMAGDKPLALTPASESGTDPSYLDADGNAIPERWLATLEATQRYIGKPIKAVEVFNEPDYWAGYGTPQTLRDIMLLVKDSPYFPGAELQAASTLCSCAAQDWYDAVSDIATHGTTHQLASWWGQGSDNYINFIEHVIANGDIAYNPEFHSMAEVLYGAEYGQDGGIWWADALLPRGILVNAIQGKRLGYAELRWTDSAAAVYRHPNGQVYGLAGSFERTGPNQSYRLLSDDKDLYFDGIGPLREYMMTTWADPQGGFVRIDESPVIPALDGHRWKIVNKAGNRVLEVAGGSTENGANLQTAKDTDELYQKWDINSSRDGYINLVNAATGKAADDYDWSLEDGGNIAQWDNYRSLNQVWYIEPADDGYFYIRNGHSNLLMEDIKTKSKNVQQGAFNNSDRQQWRFVLADDDIRGENVAQYAFDDNTKDSVNDNDAGIYGNNITYVDGVSGQAIDLNGGWDWWGDHVVLPDDVANSENITIATWVKWDGGPNLQRIFDFGVRHPWGWSPERYMMLTPSDAQGHLRFSMTTRSWWDEQSIYTDALPQNEWVHVAVTLGSNTVKMYINGELKVAGNMTINPSDLFNVPEDQQPAQQQNFIGRSQWGDPTLTGSIDDFRIYDYALSDAQVAELASINEE